MSKPLSEATVDALLDNLSGSDEFRTRFQANPREATRSLGTKDPAIDSLPTDPIRSLADKKAYAASRAKVRKQLLEARSPFIPISLEVSKS